MKINIENLHKIYERLGDEISKELFKNRLMYSISNDVKWIIQNLKYVQGGKFIQKLDDISKGGGRLVIFGKGFMGEKLYQVTKGYPWKYVVDNYSEDSEFQGLPVVKGSELKDIYDGEYVIITPKKNNNEIYEQLLNAGVSDSHIINAGKIWNELAEKQYFDLEYLTFSEEKEVFLDIGGLDGMTSVYFSKRCQKDYLAYVFEPDRANIKKCYENLENHHVNFQIVEKGAWERESVMSFQAKGNASSSIHSMGNEKIIVTSIDKELENEKVTFIKMDIEGAELSALKGAKNTIIRDKPKLAISIYHKPEDIWEIPNLILEYNPSYRLFLRHYTLIDADTILYAIP